LCYSSTLCMLHHNFLLHAFLLCFLTWVVQWSRLALSKGTNKLDVFLSSPEDGNRSSFWNVMFSNFIFVGCILLHYLHTLYKYTTQKPYICDPQTQLTTSLLFQNLTTCFGPYGPSSGENFEDSHSTATHPSFLQVWGYLLLLNLYVYNAKEV
jgi:hypothetical protein